jgi:two-component system, NarL family, sensor histidine kinase BarA
MSRLYSKPLSGRLLSGFAVLVIALAAGALIVRYTVSRQLSEVVRQVGIVEQNAARPQRILMLLHEAENEFQESFLTDSMPRNAAYRATLQRAFSAADSLLHTDSLQPYLHQYADLRTWYVQKAELADKLNLLKSDVDSFLMIDAGFTEARTTGASNITIPTHAIPHTEQRTDTLKRSVGGKRKKLIGRLKDAILNKNIHSSETYVQVFQKTTDDSISYIDGMPVRYRNGWYRRTLLQLHQHSADLSALEQDLIALNRQINKQLKSIVGGLDDAQRRMTAALRSAALDSYRDSLAVINGFCIAALLLLLLFAAMLIAYIRGLAKAEAMLVRENERAISIARQKMDLLQHMSHEIRNPISNIQGFLEVFGRTGLSAQQTEMLSSVSLSSGMLLHTVNDVLAAAKMEHSEFTLSRAAFNPANALWQTVESMRFGAQKKGLTLGYEFAGDKATTLLGDRFRLEQVMINLLSNAIKYTDTGGINVTAILRKTNGRHDLEVSVTDSGVGIAPHEQARLFSKYYQTSAAMGKMGTGLGLYICKRFIELQGGSVTVKSTPGKGSTFAFHIPYDAAPATGGKPAGATKDPASLLNGLSILVVDDNHLSLKFLKMMMMNWNVRPFFAGNGKEAMAILAGEHISVVFTDINMPEMDGFELLAAIRNLPAPGNALPVIAMNGDLDRYDEKTLLKKGFSAVGNKPIPEARMAELIVTTLQIS